MEITSIIGLFCLAACIIAIILPTELDMHRSKLKRQARDWNDDKWVECYNAYRLLRKENLISKFAGRRITSKMYKIDNLKEELELKDFKQR